MERFFSTCVHHAKKKPETRTAVPTVDLLSRDRFSAALSPDNLSRWVLIRMNFGLIFLEMHHSRLIFHL